jgi:hypothetical protein
MRNFPLHTSIFLNGLLTGSLRYEMLSSRAWRVSQEYFAQDKSIPLFWWLMQCSLDLFFGTVFGENEHCRNCYEHQVKELGHLWGINNANS